MLLYVDIYEMFLLPDIGIGISQVLILITQKVVLSGLFMCVLEYAATVQGSRKKKSLCVF